MHTGTNQLFVWLGCGWLVLTIIGSLTLTRYSHLSGIEQRFPEKIPSELNEWAAPDKHTLFMFVHTGCPCTHASISELARLMSRTQSRLEARLLTYHPGGENRSEPWTSFLRIPGVTLVPDEDRGLAYAAGTITSGQVLCYDPSGRLVFHGGITAARGHEGDNRGRTAIENIVLRGDRSISTTPVFGCQITKSPPAGGSE